MKKIYLWISGILFLIGLIICFENIATPATVLIIFKTFNSSMFFPFLFMLVLGFFAGVLFGVAQKMDTKKDDEDDYY